MNPNASERKMEKFGGSPYHLMAIHQCPSLTEIDHIQSAIVAFTSGTAGLRNKIAEKTELHGVSRNGLYPSDKVARIAEHHQLALFEFGARQPVHQYSVPTFQRLTDICGNTIYGKRIGAHCKYYD